MTEKPSLPKRQGILSLTIKDKDSLYSAYMPFVSNGGLFVATTREYQLGEEVFMLLSLMDEAERIPIAGKVAWITPKRAQGYRSTGIGIQFSEQDNGVARNKIENYLAGALEKDQQTHTM